MDYSVVKTQLFFYLFLTLGLTACNSRLQTPVLVDTALEETQKQNTPTIALDQPAPPPQTEKPVVTAAPTVPVADTKKTETVIASKLIIAAYNVLTQEGQKIGTACNLYVYRVLQVMGFKVVDFLANDFDGAAKKIFKDYKVVFLTNPTELKRHLWSYRERTGFIIQWERSSGSGHIGIVERVGETLYIYHASLDKHTARIDKTTLEKLLAINDNQGLRVYSDLVK